jgi:predicted NBD/HSP70 family sugar kinase
MTEFSALSSSPRRIRQTNAIAALQAIFRHGRLSRAQLARQLHLNRSSSGHIVSELTANGLVRERVEDKSDSSESVRAGRPGISLELIPDAAFFLGVEIGVEHITTLRIDLNANVCAYLVEPFDGRSVDVLEAVERAVEIAFRDIPPSLAGRCRGFGLSAPAQMDPRGQVSTAPLLGWQDVNLTAVVQQSLPSGVPVMVENDANAFAIGEAYMQQGNRAAVTLFLVIESGVGGGIVIDGNLFRGGHGLAGEIGHMYVPEGEGKELESLVGLDQLLNRHRKATGNSDATLAEFIADVRDRSPSAVTIAEDWSRHLAFAIVQACRLIDPDRLVLGGSVAALYPLVAARVKVHAKSYQSAHFPLPEIVVHENAETGAALGAARLLHQRFLSVENELFTEELQRDTKSPPSQLTGERSKTKRLRKSK